MGKDLTLEELARKSGPISWENLERAYDRKLSDEDRRELECVLDQYLRNAPSEWEAPYVNDAIERVEKMDKLAKDLWLYLSGETCELPPLAANYADCQIDASMHGAVNIQSLGEYLHRLHAACEKAKKEISRPGIGFEEGRAWRCMVASVASWR